MELIRPLPSNRTLEQIRNHYNVEKALADQLKAADINGRKQIYATMYDELFEKVPDHPRLTKRSSAEKTALGIRAKMAMLRRFLKSDTVLLEIAPGDCIFATEVAKHVQHVHGVDISDQRKAEMKCPDNFSLHIYDGYELNTIADDSIDTAFSDQLLEHFHPEDTQTHLNLIRRLLKPGGKYVFRTPHRYMGPHDVSLYFSDEAQGFHLKEWTYGEFKKILADCGYTSIQTFYVVRNLVIRLPVSYFLLCEALFKLFPRKIMRFLSHYFIHTICIAVEK